MFKEPHKVKDWSIPDLVDTSENHLIETITHA